MEQKGRAFLFALSSFFLMAFVQSLCSTLISDFAGAQMAQQQRALTLGLAALILIAIILLSEKKLSPPLFPLHLISGRVKVVVICACLVFGAAANFMLAASFSLVPFRQEFLEQYMQAVPIGKGTAAWVELVSLCVLVPVMEELLFRGVILHSLAQAFPLKAAVIMQCLLFAWGHGHILWLLYALMMGLVLTWVMWKTQTLQASIAFHMAFNGANYIQPLLTNAAGESNIVLFSIAAVSLLLCALAVYVICRAAGTRLFNR